MTEMLEGQLTAVILPRRRNSVSRISLKTGMAEVKLLPDLRSFQILT